MVLSSFWKFLQVKNTFSESTTPNTEIKMPWQKCVKFISLKNFIESHSDIFEKRTEVWKQEPNFRIRSQILSLPFGKIRRNNSVARDKPFPIGLLFLLLFLLFIFVLVRLRVTGRAAHGGTVWITATAAPRILLVLVVPFVLRAFKGTVLRDILQILALKKAAVGYRLLRRHLRF
jgi:hypothetical protein